MKFSPKNGASLALNGSLEDNNSQLETRYYDMIHGRTWDDKIITLWKCLEINNNRRNLTGIVTSSLEIAFIFEGRHSNS